MTTLPCDSRRAGYNGLHGDQAPDHVDVELAPQRPSESFGDRHRVVVEVREFTRPSRRPNSATAVGPPGLDTAAWSTTSPPAADSLRPRASPPRPPTSRRLVEVSDHELSAPSDGAASTQPRPMPCAPPMIRIALPSGRPSRPMAQWLKLDLPASWGSGVVSWSKARGGAGRSATSRSARSRENPLRTTTRSAARSWRFSGKRVRRDQPAAVAQPLRDVEHGVVLDVLLASVKANTGSSLPSVMSSKGPILPIASARNIGGRRRATPAARAGSRRSRAAGSCSTARRSGCRAGRS